MNRYGWIFLITLSILLTVGTCKGQSPPPQDKCANALSACQTLVDTQDAQITLLQAEVAAYRKEVDGSVSSIVPYTVISGAIAGAGVGACASPTLDVMGAARGAIAGAVLGYVVGVMTK